MDKHWLPNPWPGRCFGCSPHNPYGLQLRFWRSEGGCSTQCVIPDHLCGWEGWAHGGVIAALLDEIAAWSIIAQLGRFGITGRLAIRYVKPVPIHTELLARGQILQHSASFAEARSTIHSLAGELLASGESKWVLPKMADLEQITGLDAATLQRFFDQLATSP